MKRNYRTKSIIPWMVDILGLNDNIGYITLNELAKILKTEKNKINSRFVYHKIKFSDKKLIDDVNTKVYNIKDIKSQLQDKVFNKYK